MPIVKAACGFSIYLVLAMVLLGRSFFRKHRNAMLLMASLSTMLPIAAAAMCGAANPHAVWRAARSVPTIALLLQVQFAWQVSVLLTYLAWTLPQLCFVCWNGTGHCLWPCLLRTCARTLIGSVFAPLFILYVMEVVSRRVFLSHHALKSEATHAD